MRISDWSSDVCSSDLDIDAVEALSLDRIMGSEATEKHLEDEQRQHHEQIFTERALRWRQRRERQRITVRRDERRVVILAKKGPAPDQRADSRAQDDDAGDRKSKRLNSSH